MSKKQVAVVGLGYWGLRCAVTLSDLFPDFELLLVESDGRKRSRAQNSFPRSKVLALYQDLADSDVGTVLFAVVATPPGSHADITLFLLRAGVSVLLEKPFSLNKSDLEEAHELRGGGVVLGAGYLYAHNPLVLFVRDLISSGEYGELLHVESIRQGFGAFRHDVSIVRDLLVHDISIAICLFEERAITVRSAKANLVAHTGFHSEVEATFSVENSTSFTARCSQIRPRKIRTLTFFFRSAIVLIDEMNPTKKVRLFELPTGLLDGPKPRPQAPNEYLELREVSSHSFEEDALSPLGHSLSKFARAVLSGEDFATGIEFANQVASLADNVEQEIAATGVAGAQ